MTIMIILSLFLATQFIGLTANNIFLETELPYSLQPPDIEPTISPWFFITMLIIISVFFLVMKRFRLEIFMKVWFFFAFLVTVAITLSAFIDPGMALIVSLAIVVLKFKEHDLYVHNMGELLIYGGVVALFAPVLNFWAAVILLIGISVYDYVAVFITKHMVELAKMTEKMGIFSGLLVVNGDEVAILGGGDIAFTLLFAVVALREFGMTSALFAIYGATIFIGILMLIGKKKKYYPAMPFVTAGTLLGFLISLI